MFLKIKMCKNIYMRILKCYGYSGYGLQDDTTTTIHIVTCTMLVDTAVHTGL